MMKFWIGIGADALVRLADEAEQFERLVGLGAEVELRRGERTAGEQLTGEQLLLVGLGQRGIVGGEAVAAEHLGEGGAQLVGVLAEVERGEVEAEDARLPDEHAEPAVGQALAVAFAQAVLHEAEVGDEVFDAVVGVGAGQVIGAPRPAVGVERGGELAVDVGALVAVGLHGIARVDAAAPRQGRARRRARGWLAGRR